MKGCRRHIFTIGILVVFLCGSVQGTNAQMWRKKDAAKYTVEEFTGKIERSQGGELQYFVEDGDTIYFDYITASKVYSRLPKQKGKEWRKYYRLVHNFSKAYPYALVVKKLVIEADSTITADNLKGVKREKYIAQVQKELFDVFESQMRSLTVSQGALIMKLVDREVGKSSYNLIKGYTSGITAGFWQGIAKIFGSDLKKPYDPEGEDANTEELVQIWEAGDFDAFYFSIFWKDPPKMPIPEKYL
ncbi:MAG: DUF4294 domain-containing protein [Bacteroidales bacterium]|nr:DUF4294 domain-containing protein [Bacteroidales bacterium]